MSSMNTTTNLFSTDMNKEVIRYMKCEGAFVSPNDNQILVQPVPGGECGFRDVFRTDLDLMITRPEIDLGENLSTD
jgi:hypothetical protein